MTHMSGSVNYAVVGGGNGLFHVRREAITYWIYILSLRAKFDVAVRCTVAKCVLIKCIVRYETDEHMGVIHPCSA